MIFYAADFTEFYLYTYTCLQYGYYEECIDLCNHITAHAKSIKHGRAFVAMMKGKAHMQICTCQLHEVMHQGRLETAVPWMAGDFVDQCATNAKEAVKALGFALDQGLLDEEGSRLLDTAMLVYLKIKKKIDPKDFKRCLLCRRRGVKLKGSHTIPKFLAKKILNIGKEGLKKMNIEEFAGENLLYSGSGKFSAHTHKNILTYTLLCARCEQCLTQNGEDQFCKEFMSKIYSESEEVELIKYDRNLYSFCLGVLFRSYANHMFHVFPNANELYSIFVACRQHLLSLSVTCTEEKKISDPPPIVDTLVVEPPDTYLILSPFQVHVANASIIPLAASLSSFCGIWYLTTPLDMEPETELCHAIIVRAGLCNLVIPLSAAQGATLDQSLLVYPQGGKYPILPDIERWSAIPHGLYETFITFAVLFMKQYEQVLYGMKTTQGDSRKADTYIRVMEGTFNMPSIEHGPINPKSLKYLPQGEAKLISMYFSNSLFKVNLVPKGPFYLNPFPQQLILGEGHKLLYHIHIKEEATFFFVASKQYR